MEARPLHLRLYGACHVQLQRVADGDTESLIICSINNEGFEKMDVKVWSGKKATPKSHQLASARRPLHKNTGRSRVRAVQASSA
eukprot:6878248-Alexandrium_andersonii.AAC.1